MNLLYKKIAEVQVWHDYYLVTEVLQEDHLVVQALLANPDADGFMASVENILNDDTLLTDDENKAMILRFLSNIRRVQIVVVDAVNEYHILVLPEQYNILNDLDFLPTPQCAALLKNQKILFRKSPTGFILLARVVPLESDPTLFRTFIFIDPEIKFDFFIVVRNPFFGNFTNIRLTGKNNTLYYFNNLNKSPIFINDLYLTLPHLIPPTEIEGETGYLLGDIVEENNLLYELSDNLTDPLLFDPNQAVEIADNITRYVTAQDCLKWQLPNYQFRADNNLNAGELVRFNLTDINGVEMNLGSIPNTNQSQGQYRSPADTNLPLFHTINLANIPQGRYTMEVERISETVTDIFYLLNPLIQSDAFGIIELFPNATEAEFVTYQDNESVFAPRTYQIRFKNRSTVWQYFDNEETELTDPLNEQLLPLTRQHSEFQLDNNIVPDPDISIIYPLTDTNGTIEKIYSKTYLNQ